MKISKWIYTAALGLLFASCQSVETPMFSDKNDTFVAFDKKTFVFAENSEGELKIPVSLVASKSYDVSVNFSIDATTYEGKAAIEGVHYEMVTEGNTLTFADGDESLTQYVVIKTINNDDFGGDVYFDVTLSFDEATRCRCHDNGIHISYGANYIATVTIQDDDHPLKQLGILGTYECKASSPFDGSDCGWTCVITGDPDNVNGVYLSQLAAPAGSLAPEFTPVYGVWDESKNAITIEADQEAGTVMGYTMKVNFYGPTSADAFRNDSKFTLSGYVLYEAYEDGESVGYVAGAYGTTMTKIGE